MEGISSEHLQVVLYCTVSLKSVLFCAFRPVFSAFTGFVGCVQENSTVVCLNLSKNKIEINGGRILGAALCKSRDLCSDEKSAGSPVVCASLSTD